MNLTESERLKIENRIKTVVDSLLERNIYSRIHLFNIVDNESKVFGDLEYQEIIIKYLDILRSNMMKQNMHKLLYAGNCAYLDVDEELGLHGYSLEDLKIIISSSVDWDSFNTQFEYIENINFDRGPEMPETDIYIDISDSFNLMKNSGIKTLFRQFQHDDTGEFIHYLVFEI